MCQAAERRFDLVTTDVDGTLLSTKNELSPRNEEAIAECIKLGIPVCIGAQSQTLWIFLQAWAGKFLPLLRNPLRLSCRALNTSCYVATGKARGPWCKKVLPKLGAPMPGVYMQGLLIYNADGSIMHEESLSEDLVRETITLAKELGMWPVLQQALCNSSGNGAQHLWQCLCLSCLCVLVKHDKEIHQ